MKILNFIIGLIIIQPPARNTLKGIGQDIQKGGRAIERSANSQVGRKEIEDDR